VIKIARRDTSLEESWKGERVDTPYAIVKLAILKTDKSRWTVKIIKKETLDVDDANSLKNESNSGITSPELFKEMQLENKMQSRLADAVIIILPMQIP
jgi:hypothetical protein